MTTIYGRKRLYLLTILVHRQLNVVLNANNENHQHACELRSIVCTTFLFGFSSDEALGGSHTIAIQVWINIKKLYSIHLFYHLLCKKINVKLLSATKSSLLLFSFVQCKAVVCRARAAKLFLFVNFPLSWVVSNPAKWSVLKLWLEMFKIGKSTNRQLDY